MNKNIEIKENDLEKVTGGTPQNIILKKIPDETDVQIVGVTLHNLPKINHESKHVMDGTPTADEIIGELRS